MRQPLAVLVAIAWICLLSGWQSKPTPRPLTGPPIPTAPILYQAELTIKADPAWTPSEQNRLRQILRQAYPALVKLYGKPSAKGIVTLKKSQGVVSSLGTSILNDKRGRLSVRIDDYIKLSGEAVEFPSLLVHELGHRFHGQSMVIMARSPKSQLDGLKTLYIHTAVEEGMAQAISNIVSRQLGYPADKSHAFQIGPGFNKAALSFYHIDASESLYGIRMNLAAWAFEQWENRHPGFLRRFNRALYALPPANRPLDYPTGWRVADQVTPGAAKWFTSQAIFTFNPPPGPFLYVIGDQKLAGIGLYNRGQNGAEKPLVGEKVMVTIRVGKKIVAERAFVTDDAGVIPIHFDDAPAKLYAITARWRDKVDTFSYP